MDKSLTVGELFLLMDSGLMVERSENKSYNTVLNKIKATDHKIVSKDDKMITVEMEKGKHNSVYLVIYYFENQLLSRGPKIYKKNE